MVIIPHDVQTFKNVVHFFGLTHRHSSSSNFYFLISLIHLSFFFLVCFLVLVFVHLICFQHLVLRRHWWIAISPLLLSKTLCCILPTEKLYSVANNETNNKDSGMANNKTNTKESGRDLASIAMPPVLVVKILYSCFMADFGCLASREQDSSHGLVEAWEGSLWTTQPKYGQQSLAFPK